MNQMNQKFSYALKILLIQYWKLEERILILLLDFSESEKMIRDLKDMQFELDDAIKLLEKNQ